MGQTVRTWIALVLAITALGLVSVSAVGPNSNLSDHPVESRLIALEKLSLTLNRKVEDLESELSEANATIAKQQQTIKEQRDQFQSQQAKNNS